LPSRLKLSEIRHCSNRCAPSSPQSAFWGKTASFAGPRCSDECFIIWREHRGGRSGGWYSGGSWLDRCICVKWMLPKPLAGQVSSVDSGVFHLASTLFLVGGHRKIFASWLQGPPRISRTWQLLSPAAQCAELLYQGATHLPAFRRADAPAKKAVTLSGLVPGHGKKALMGVSVDQKTRSSSSRQIERITLISRSSASQPISSSIGSKGKGK